MPLTSGQIVLVTATFDARWASGRVECDKTRNGIFPLAHVADVGAPTMSEWRACCVDEQNTSTEAQEIERLSNEMGAALQKCWPVLQV